MKKYDFGKIEKKWQKEWEESNLYAAKDGARKPKYYALIEFPYPSGAGLHVGHTRSFTAMDIIARKRRMQGYNVLYPIGWDAFGIPTETYAIKTGIPPAKVTKENTDTFRRQLKSLGFSFDWSREVNTSDPAYYKWTQWLFLQFFKHGLAYKANMPINWCPKDKVGLANEEVVGGKCERCGTPVEKRDKSQWMLRITAYADKLLEGLRDLDFLPEIKHQQEHWIGRSEGAEIDFEVPDKPKKAVILHAFRGTPTDLFYPWLKGELEKRGWTVKIPHLQYQDDPRIMTHVDRVLREVAFDEQTVLIAHSVGSVLALKILEQIRKPIGRLVIAGGFIEPKFKDHPRPFANLFDWKFDFDRIRKNVRDVRILRDAHDNVIPEDQAEKLATALGGRLSDVTADDWHFCGAAEPTVLRETLDAIPIFTTRPDTLFGATYMVLAPEHPLIPLLAERITNIEDVRAYITSAQQKTETERTENKEKTGIALKGVKAINPGTGKEIPIWVSDYVLAGYGTGAIMAVPAHDERDHEFAKKFKLPIIQVITSSDAVSGEIWTGKGVLQNSNQFDGVASDTARWEITKFVRGRRKVQYKLHDWVFSRQRYWGEPIPIIHCESCGYVPVPESELPVELPKVKEYAPRDDGESPLASIASWVNVPCPSCGAPAERETDVMPNWAGSSWYFLRYLDPQNADQFADPKKMQYWMPVDWYDGGMEHVTLHLLYSRFWNLFFYDHGLVPVKEPYRKRTSHGLILGEGGVKMSKSKGNVVNPDDVVKACGADALRLYEMFVGPFNQDVAWDRRGIEGVIRFLGRVWAITHSELIEKRGVNENLERLLHKTIKKVGDDIEVLGFNTAVSALMIFANECQRSERIPQYIWEAYLQLLAPFAPHITEELWRETLGKQKSIHTEAWPSFDPARTIDQEVTLIIQVNGKVRDEMVAPVDTSEADAAAQALGRERVQKFTLGAQPKKIIYVPGRLINIVV